MKKKVRMDGWGTAWSSHHEADWHPIAELRLATSGNSAAKAVHPVRAFENIEDSDNSGFRNGLLGWTCGARIFMFRLQFRARAMSALVIHER